ncbi:MAG: serine/threonine protein kinase [Deltaproteobacteria bacterium]|nr:serine/threonine protein kinase [Deltaproteobacteria bacterium]
MSSQPTQVGPEPSQSADAELDDPPAGSLLNGIYQVRELLGEGGMARVYEAFDHELRRVVAIKVPRSVEAAPYLVEEARALATIRHPSLVTVHAIGRIDDRPYLVMERIRGLPLSDHIDRRSEAGQRFSIEEVVTLGEAIAEGLAAIHRAGVAHRDVKPSNVMLSGSRVVIMDFGLVLPEYEAGSPRMIVGSPAYMAPELVLNQMARGAAFLADLYSLGVLLFELLTLDLPFAGATPTELAMQHVKQPVPDVRRLRPDTPAPLASLVGELMAKEPAARPQNADEVVWRIRRVRSEKEVPRFSRRVLVVSSERRSRAQLRRLIETGFADVEVVEVNAIDDALRRLGHAPFDVLLIDLGTDVGSAMELCMVVAGTPELERCGLVAVGHVGPSDRALLERLGVHEVVPIGPTFDIDLAHALTRTFGRDS